MGSNYGIQKHSGSCESRSYNFDTPLTSEGVHPYDGQSGGATEYTDCISAEE